jgi:hypothetical protein
MARPDQEGARDRGVTGNGWTLDTLKELFEQRFSSQDKAVTAALQAAEKAVQKAEVAAEKRFDSVNEFRAQLSDQAATFMPRLEAEQRIAQQSEKLARVESRLDRQDGKTGGAGSLASALVAGAGLLVAVVTLGIVIFTR